MQFSAPPVRSDFIKQGEPAPTYAWERWFQAITDFLSAPQIKRYTPPASNSTGVQDSITYDNQFIYVCVAPNTWKRGTLSTF